MRLSDVIRFQKALALAASASNLFEMEAAELAARRLVATCNLDPTRIPNVSLYSHLDFGTNPLLQRLRDEWRKAHPHYSYKTGKGGLVRRLRGKPKPINTKPKRATPDPVSMYEGMFDDFKPESKPKPKPKHQAKPVKHQARPSKPSSDRNRDRHSPGYMRNYMRDYMRRRRAR
jgi:hypothetical protein